MRFKQEVSVALFLVILLSYVMYGISESIDKRMSELTKEWVK